MDSSGYVPRHDRAARQGGRTARPAGRSHLLRAPGGPAEPVTLGGLVETCARVAGTSLDVVPVPPETAPAMYPLVRQEWSTHQRDPARARAAGLPATPLETTIADVLAWDRDRGEPPLDTRGFTPGQEQAILSGR